MSKVHAVEDAYGEIGVAGRIVLGEISGERVHVSYMTLVLGVWMVWQGDAPTDTPRHPPYLALAS